MNVYPWNLSYWFYFIYKRLIQFYLIIYTRERTNIYSYFSFLLLLRNLLFRRFDFWLFNFFFFFALLFFFTTGRIKGDCKFFLLLFLLHLSCRRWRTLWSFKSCFYSYNLSIIVAQRILFNLASINDFKGFCWLATVSFSLVIVVVIFN